MNENILLLLWLLTCRADQKHLTADDGGARVPLHTIHLSVYIAMQMRYYTIRISTLTHTHVDQVHTPPLRVTPHAGNPPIRVPPRVKKHP